MGGIDRPMSGRAAPTGRDYAHDYRRRIGGLMAQLRESAGLRQQDVAAALGMGISGVSGFERGRVTVSPETYLAIADLYGLSEHKRKEIGKMLLRYTNPWLFALIYGEGDKELADDLVGMSPRLNALRDQKLPKKKGA